MFRRWWPEGECCHPMLFSGPAFRCLQAGVVRATTSHEALPQGCSKFGLPSLREEIFAAFSEPATDGRLSHGDGLNSPPPS